MGAAFYTGLYHNDNNKMQKGECDMNKWQKEYCVTNCGGKLPTSKAGKQIYGLLENIKDSVTVEFPELNQLNGVVPAHTETYAVIIGEDDMPNGKISVATLASNLVLWTNRGYKITTE